MNSSTEHSKFSSGNDLKQLQTADKETPFSNFKENSFCETVYNKSMNGFVGFANLPNQIHRDSIHEGFQFTLMAVGESGVGKSTLLNSLFSSSIYQETGYPRSSIDNSRKTLSIESTMITFEEKGVRLNLTIVDTPGFCDAIDSVATISPIKNYIMKQYQNYLDLESRVRRINFLDKRVHACLYIIPPYSHGLRAIDIKFMKELGNCVNIIPIIGKADALNDVELVNFKQAICEDIEEHDIKVFDFSLRSEKLKESKPLFPFSTIASTTFCNINNIQFTGREYPWGTLNTESKETSDFYLLRQYLIRTHMQALIDQTHENLYENYREMFFSTMQRDGSACDNLMDAFDDEMREHEEAMQRLRERLKSMFDEKVQQKENKLKFEMDKVCFEIEKEEKINLTEKKKLEELKKSFEEEHENFQMHKGKRKEPKRNE